MALFNVLMFCTRNSRVTLRMGETVAVAFFNVLLFCALHPWMMLRMTETVATYTLVRAALVPGRLLLRAYRFVYPRVDKGSYQVFVQTGKGTLALDVQSTYTIGNLKWQIFFRNNWMVEHQRLIYCGKQLADDTTLAAAGVAKRATLHLAGRVRGGVPSAGSSSSLSWRPAKTAEEALRKLPDDYKLYMSEASCVSKRRSMANEHPSRLPLRMAQAHRRSSW